MKTPHIRIEWTYPIDFAHYPGACSVADAYRIDVGMYNDNEIGLNDLVGLTTPDTEVAVSVIDTDLQDTAPADTPRVRIDMVYPVDLAHYPGASSIADAYRIDVGMYNDNRIGLNDLIASAFDEDITVTVLDADATTGSTP